MCFSSLKKYCFWVVWKMLRPVISKSFHQYYTANLRRVTVELKVVKTQLTGFSSDLWDLLQTPPTNRDQLGAPAHVKNLSLRPLQLETNGHCTKYKNRGNSDLILSERDWTFVEISFSYQNEYEFTLFIIF